MSMAEVKEMTDEELLGKKEECENEMMILRLQAAKGVLENPARVRLIRRDVARINTILHERRSLSVAEKNNGK